MALFLVLSLVTFKNVESIAILFLLRYPCGCGGKEHLIPLLILCKPFSMSEKIEDRTLLINLPTVYCILCSTSSLTFLCLLLQVAPHHLRLQLRALQSLRMLSYRTLTTARGVATQSCEMVFCTWKTRKPRRKWCI